MARSHWSQGGKPWFWKTQGCLTWKSQVHKKYFTSSPAAVADWSCTIQIPQEHAERLLSGWKKLLYQQLRTRSRSQKLRLKPSTLQQPPQPTPMWKLRGSAVSSQGRPPAAQKVKSRELSNGRQDFAMSFLGRWILRSWSSLTVTGSISRISDPQKSSRGKC